MVRTTKFWNNNDKVSIPYQSDDITFDQFILGAGLEDIEVKRVMAGREGEQQLWADVMLLAVKDAVNPGKTVNRRRERDQAREWLLGNSADFQQVCEFAGINPEAMREKLLELLD